MKKTIVVVGAGKGLGNAVGEKFGKNNFRVILMSRSVELLKEYQNDFKAKGIEVYTKTVDVAEPDFVSAVFDELKKEFGIPDVLFYNVGITSADADLTVPKDVNLLLDRYKVDVAGAYHAIQQVLGEEFSAKEGSILVTGGGLAMYPMDAYLPLSMDKAALRAMCIALHNALKEQNVYLGTVTVTNTIAPGGPADPVVIAEDFWKLYTDRKDCEFVR